MNSDNVKADLIEYTDKVLADIDRLCRASDRISALDLHGESDFGTAFCAHVYRKLLLERLSSVKLSPEMLTKFSDVYFSVKTEPELIAVYVSPKGFIKSFEPVYVGRHIPYDETSDMIISLAGERRLKRIALLTNYTYGSVKEDLYYCNRLYENLTKSGITLIDIIKADFKSHTKSRPVFSVFRPESYDFGGK